jgi:hypothetical protein
MNALQLLKDKGYKPISDLNYCTESGIEYYIGFKGDKAAIAAMIHDESIYFITKDELRLMSLTAKVAGIHHVTLFTNYGIELHSKLEKPECIGFNKIHKLSTF